MLDAQSRGHSVAFIMCVPPTLHLLRSEAVSQQLDKGGTSVPKSNLSFGYIFTVDVHRFVREPFSSAGSPWGAGVVSQWE